VQSLHETATMSEYPNAPAYGINYGAQDQTNPPYVPPAYPTQYMQPVDGRMGNGMASSYDMSNSAYGYNAPPPAFSASAIASGVPPLPIFPSWNQNPGPLPTYNSHNGQQYMSYSDQNAQSSQHNSQYYVAQAQPVYQPVSQPSRLYDEGEVSESEINGSRPQVNNSNSSYGGIQYTANNRVGYTMPSQQTMYPTSQEQTQQRPFITCE
jgi:hypothetical protein